MTVYFNLAWIIGMVVYFGCLNGVSRQNRGISDIRATIWLVTSFVVIALWWVIVGRLLVGVEELTAALMFGGMVIAGWVLSALIPTPRRTEAWPRVVSTSIAVFFGLCCIAVPILALRFPSTCNFEDHLCVYTRSKVVHDGWIFVAPLFLGWGLLSRAAYRASAAAQSRNS